MAIEKKLIDQLLADYKKAEDIIGENGLLKQLTKAIPERALQAELTDHLGQDDFFAWVEILIVLGVTVFLLRRLGLLWLVVTWVFASLPTSFPLTTQSSAWYAGISLTGILLMAAMAFYGFYTSLGDRPVFGGAVLEE